MCDQILLNFDSDTTRVICWSSHLNIGFKVRSLFCRWQKVKDGDHPFYVITFNDLLIFRIKIQVPGVAHLRPLSEMPWWPDIFCSLTCIHSSLRPTPMEPPSLVLCSLSKLNLYVQQHQLIFSALFSCKNSEEFWEFFLWFIQFCQVSTFFEDSWDGLCWRMKWNHVMFLTNEKSSHHYTIATLINWQMYATVLQHKLNTVLHVSLRVILHYMLFADTFVRIPCINLVNMTPGI